jgi:hypothetical protein
MHAIACMRQAMCVPERLELIGCLFWLELNAGGLVAPAVVDAPCVLSVLICYHYLPLFFSVYATIYLAISAGLESLRCCVLGLVCVTLLAAATPTVLGHRGVSWADR